jgi:hypothetical protein
MDDDDDGIPNVFDLLPSFNTTDIEASTSREFDLRAPAVAPDKLAARRIFQALQFTNTATNYNPTLQPLNERRRMVLNPEGAWFDRAEDPNSYIKFSPGPNGEYYVQVSTALAQMTMETLRVVFYIEMVRYLDQQNPGTFRNRGERNAMALLFAASSLENDELGRESQVLDGIKRLYGLPAQLTYGPLRTLVAQLEERHNYTGDMQAARALVQQFPALGQGRAGDPAVATA